MCEGQNAEFALVPRAKKGARETKQEYVVSKKEEDTNETTQDEKKTAVGAGALSAHRALHAAGDGDGGGFGNNESCVYN